jgi:hypothetical protein
MCEVIVHVGGSGEGGMETKSVVDVPSDKIASPGDESITIDEGLSPVNGVTMQSIRRIYKPC